MNNKLKSENGCLRVGVSVNVSLFVWIKDLLSDCKFGISVTHGHEPQEC